MPETNGGLTLEGLAQILRDHMDWTAARFADVGARFDAVVDNLHREIGTVATAVRNLADIVARQVNELEEHRQQIRQINSRMEQHEARMEQHSAQIAEHSAQIAEHSARIEELSRDIRRILDAMEGRGRDGGSRPEGRP